MLAWYEQYRGLWFRMSKYGFLIGTTIGEWWTHR